MKIVSLGNSGLRVTELCMGTLTLSPIQANLPPEAGGRLIRMALEGGVNFIDTAQGYKNYAHVRAGIRGFDRNKLVIATKSAARTARDMREAFDQACGEMGLDRLDIFLLHAIKSPDDFNARREALDVLNGLKARGLITAIGISAHNIGPMRSIAGNREIDVCHPIFNMNGLGIKDGSISDMAGVLAGLRAEGKGVYAMKPLGGGHLAECAVEALDFARRHDYVDAIAVGMKDEREVAFNLAYFDGRLADGDAPKNLSGIKRELLVNFLCKSCGTCADVCEQDALRMGKERMEVDREKCILCGYCVPECPEFAIRII